MTHIPEFLPMTDDDPLARRAFFMAFEGMGYLTSPVRSRSWSASTFVKQQGRHGYARHTVSLDGGPIVTSKGVTIETLPLAEFEGAAIDTIVVPGALDMEPALSTGAWWIGWRSTPPKARRTASVCAGAFLLAEAGLLSAMFIRAWWPRKSAFDSRAAGLSIF